MTSSWSLEHEDVPV